MFATNYTSDCRVGQGRIVVTNMFPLPPLRQTVREVFPHTAFLNTYPNLLSGLLTLSFLNLYV